MDPYRRRSRAPAPLLGRRRRLVTASPAFPTTSSSSSPKSAKFEQKPVSKSTLPYLTIDLVVDIISRLQVKDVLRCKVLSKPIYSVIKSHDFVYKHLHHSKIRAAATGTNIIVADPVKRAYEMDKITHLLFPKSKICGQSPTDGELRLIGCCNGLLFLRLEPDDILFLLWNPATKEHRTIPAPYFNVGVFGVGYDAGSDCYKVVKITTASCKRPFLVEVWSTSTNTWTEIKDTVLPKLLQGYNIDLVHGGQFLMGNLYWLAYRYDRQGPVILFSFALSNDSIRQIMLPDAVAVGERKFQFNIGEMMGSLALFCRYVVDDDVSKKVMVDIWVMEDNDGKDSWSKQPSIGPFSVEVWATPVCMNGKFLMKKLPSCEYFLYDPCTKEDTTVPFTVPFKSERAIPFWSWSESLVSVKQNGDDRDYTRLIFLEDTDLSDSIREEEENDYGQWY